MTIAAPVIGLLVLALMRVVLRKGLLALDAFAQYGRSALFAVFLIVYLANGTTPGSGDTAPARYLPFSIFREANFDEFRGLRQNLWVEM